MAGYAFTPVTNFDKQLEYCIKNNLPFQIATHYWEIDGELKEKFYKFIYNALDNGIQTKLLKEVLL